LLYGLGFPLSAVQGKHLAAVVVVVVAALVTAAKRDRSIARLPSPFPPSSRLTLTHGID